MKPLTLYDGARMTIQESIDLTLESLRTYGPRYRRWAVAWSGGKDSTTLVTLIMHMIETGLIPRPEKLYVLYADTRMELLPLSIAASQIGQQLRERGADVRTILPELDDRFFVYMLGKGPPPPNNKTLRWCTDAIKLKPMQAELQRLAGEASDKVLTLIGVRQGESAARDQRIHVACSRDGAECGQGWYQRDLPDALTDKLCPILHWRTCLVWDWLMEGQTVGGRRHHGFATRMIAEAYGQDSEGSEIETNARTGCVGCPLASRDVALEAVVALPQWSYLAPLMGLRPIYRELREAHRRLRQPPGERRKDGTLTSNQNRMGPLTMESRAWALESILAIQAAVNAQADRLGRPTLDLLNNEEVSRIRELMAANTWPQKWNGEEPRGDELYEEEYVDGSRQLLLPIINGGAP